jgi:hypothetical protein
MVSIIANWRHDYLVSACASKDPLRLDVASRRGVGQIEFGGFGYARRARYGTSTDSREMLLKKIWSALEVDRRLRQYFTMTGLDP